MLGTREDFELIRQQISIEAAASGVSTAATPLPKRTCIVETTLSFAMNPLIRAVQILQSPRPSGLNIGVINPDIAASMLSAEFVTMLK